MRMPNKRIIARIPARLLGLALAATVGASGGACAESVIAGPVAAEVVSVIDGDTLTVRARIWLDLEMTVNIRIRGIDAPEVRGHCAREKILAAAATERLGEVAGAGSVQLSNIGKDKYFGRAVADVTTPEGRSLALLMLSSGLVRDYGGGTRRGWCDLAGLAEPAG
jgi:endonuclease YncB( thermonuclease family)